jgi:3-methylcrotonyl-CoA carboxylase alpha subunit
VVTVFAGTSQRFEQVDPLARGGQSTAPEGVTLAPMPGRVVAVFVTAGDSVKAGDRLATLEAMKMEHVMTATSDGVVAEVLATAGTQVEAGAALVRMETEA